MKQKEDRCIAYLSRLHLTDIETIQTNKLLKDNLDWGYIADQSCQEGTAALLYYHLKKESLPKQSLMKLKDIYYKISALNMRILGETKKLLKIFNDENIPVILLKGTFLVENIYKNIALRPVGDIDILIKKEDL